MTQRKRPLGKPAPTPAPEPAAPGRYFRITYSNTATEDEPKLFQARDGIAFSELTAPLPALGYQFGTTIHFYPDDERRLSEYPDFRSGDLLILPTRPPLTDRECLIPPRKIIRNSRNDLEKLIFNQFFKYISYCTRKHVKLTDHAKEHVPDDPRKWESLEFFEHSGVTHRYGVAHILKHMATAQRPARHVSSTVAFLLRVGSLEGVDSTPGVPCGLLASFGIDGYSTLLWNHIVRVRYPQWLEQPSFVMAELIFKKPIPSRPLTPEFASDPDFIEVRIICETHPH